MSSLLLSIGASVAASANGLSGASRNSDQSLSRIEGSRFNDLFKQPLKVTPPSSAVSQIAGLIGSGTPLSTISARLAQQLSAKLETTLRTVSGTSLDALSHAKLIRALATALSPPDGQPPPGDSTEQAVALAQQVAQVLTSIAGDLTGPTGQQNRFSGKILDAKSAKELLAHQAPPSATSVDVVSLVESLLRGAAKNPVALPINGFKSAPQRAAPGAFGASSKRPVTLPTNGFKPQPPARVPQPDILMRIMQRAAGLARVNGSFRLASAPSSDPASASGALFVRLLAAIAKSAKDGSPGILPQIANLFGVTAPTNGDLPQVTAPASSAAYVPLDPSALIDQLVRGMLIRSSGDTSEIRMKLSPDHLGEVSLKLSVTGGTLSASIIAQSADVRDTLLANQGQLTRSLADAGLKLTSFSVDVSGGNAHGFARHQNTHHLGSSRRSFHFGDEDTGDEISAAVPTFGPPLLASSRLDLLNYLA